MGIPFSSDPATGVSFLRFGKVYQKWLGGTTSAMVYGLEYNLRFEVAKQNRLPHRSFHS
jgi:hypothetical protein